MRVHSKVRKGLRWIGAAALCATASVACGAPDRVPPDLVGVWKTKAERHADAFFEIRPSSVMVGVGTQPLEVLWFDDLQIEKDANGNDVLRFHYPGETGSEVLVVTRLRGRRAIRIGAGEGTWYLSKSR
jgi:hypothetical protein